MKIKTLINTILIVTMLLLLTLQSLADEVNEEKYPDISLIHDKTLSIDKIIGEKQVLYYEHFIDDVQIKNNYILIHKDITTGELIKYKKSWTESKDIQIQNFKIDFSSVIVDNYHEMKKVMFMDEKDTMDFYQFNKIVEYPVICLEVHFKDGRTILYDNKGEEIGQGIPIPSESFIMSGPGTGGTDTWSEYRINADKYYSRWCDSYISVFNPYPSTEISPRVSNQDVELFYELAHGGSTSFVAHITNSGNEIKYYSSKLSEDMSDRNPMKFAFIGSCEGMTNTGSGTFSYAFRKGQITNTVTVGFTAMTQSAFVYAKHWQNHMFALMDQAYTIKDAFEEARAEYPLIANKVKFVGDETIKVRSELTNRPPITPYYPSPSDNIDDRDIEVNLIWSGGDPDCWDVGDAEEDSVYYDIYFDNDPNPSYKDTIGPFPGNPSEIEYDPGELEHDTRYYWKIVARDNHDAETTGPIWNFKTTDYCEEQLDQYNTQEYIGHTEIINGCPKAQSFIPSKNFLSKISLLITKTGMPADDLEMIICDDSSGEPDLNNKIISISLPPEYIDRDFSWIEFDLSDVYVNPGETYYIILSTAAVMDVNLNNCYWWRYSLNSYPNGQHWRYNLNTGLWNINPSIDFCFKTYGLYDFNPTPINNTINTPINVLLSWEGPETVSYDVYLENNNSDPNVKVSDNQTSQTFQTNSLNYNTDYYWKIVARDSQGIETEGPIWHFKTVACPGNNIDQQQIQSDEFYFFKYETVIFAQSFKPGKANLSSVELFLKKLGNPGDITVELKTSLQGIALASISKKASSIPSSLDWIEFDFSDINVNIGQTYYIVISAETISKENDYSLSIGHETDYENGMLHRQINEEGWKYFQGSDLTFRTYSSEDNVSDVYMLNINIRGNGTATKNPNKTTYNHGEVVTLTATPEDENFIFHHWYEETTGCIYENITEIIMDDDKTITANFTLRGDVNYDGGVGAADITYVQEIMFGNLEEIPATDVNQDGNINIEDIQTIEQIFLGHTPN